MGVETTYRTPGGFLCQSSLWGFVLTSSTGTHLQFPQSKNLSIQKSFSPRYSSMIRANISTPKGSTSSSMSKRLLWKG